MEVTMKLEYLDGLLRGPEKTVNLENPDPHPKALLAMAWAWARTLPEHKWTAVIVKYDGKTIRQSAE